jgi:hypothetical protein
MQVYHGGYTEIVQVDLNKTQANKDFGKGFYVTKNYRHAENWAKIIGRKHHTEGFITEFTFNERAFTDERYRVLRFNEYNEAWLDFVVLNRDESTDESRHEFDIVEGPIADDKVASRINDYLANRITKAGFLKELRYHEETHQLCFCSIKSLQMLKRADKTHAINNMHIGRAIVAALMIDKQTNEATAADLFYNSNIFTQLANPATGFHSKTWQEIYEMLKQEMDASHRR